MRRARSVNRCVRSLLSGLESLERRTVMTAGALDPTFGGGDGIVSHYMSPKTLAGGGMQLDGDQIVVAGTVQGATTTTGTGRKAVTTTDPADFAVGRFNSDGSMDSTFGGGGLATTTFGANVHPDYSDHVEDFAIDADGNYVVVGRSYQSHTVTVNRKTTTYTSFDFAIARFTSSGSLDTSFSGDGRATLEFAAPSANAVDQAYAVVIQTDGKILVGGETLVATSDKAFAIARFNPDGTLDSAFGTGGKVITNLEPRADLLYDLALQTVGTNTYIVAAGQTLVGTTSTDYYDAALVRYTLDGQLDSSFGSAGIVRTHVAGSDGITGIAIGSDGGIYAAGGTTHGGGTDISLTRYAPNGTVDWMNVVPLPHTQVVSALTLQPDGKPVIAGTSFHSDTISLGRESMAARFLATGELDQTFSSSDSPLAGISTWETNTSNNGANDEGVDDVILQGDKLLVLGSIEPVGTANRTTWTLSRLEGDMVALALLAVLEEDSSEE